MTVELHLPDLPEVPIALGRSGDVAPPRESRLRAARWRDALSAWLPLLLMALLAAGSWWLVKNAPGVLPPKVEAPPRSDPDYTMTRVVLERFEPRGRLKARLEGQTLRHFPDTDRIEVDALSLSVFAPDGRVTIASARRGLSNGDGSEVQLFGDARVETVDSTGVRVTMSSEFLHLFTVTERVRTHLPVLLRRGNSEFRAGSLDYDHALGHADFGGPVRGTFPPKGL